MNVLMTTDSVTGVWTFCAELARALDVQDVPVTLAVMGPQLSREQRSQVDGLSNVHLLEGHFRLEWMQEPWQDRHRASQWLLEIIEKLEADVVHLTGYVYSCVDWPVPVVVSAQHDPINWWRAIRGEGPSGMLESYQHQAAECLGCADLVVAPTYSTLAQFRKEYGLLSRSTVIRNGRSSLLFEPGDKRQFVLGVGSLRDGARNMATLLEATRRLPCPVYIAGDHESGSAEAWTNGGAKTLGPLSAPAMAEWLGKASIFASPALYDPLGYSVIEAALSGCALVLSDIPSYRELWDDAAVFVDATDSEELAMAVRYLLADRRLCKSLSRKAYDIATTMNPSAMARQYLQAYREIRSKTQLDQNVILAGRLKKG